MFDKNTIEGLFRQHYGKMINLASILLADDAEAQDVVQEVFARLMEHDFQMSVSKVEGYLMTAVRNSCLNAIRQKGVRQRVRGLLPVDEADDVQSVQGQIDKLEQVHTFVDTRLKEPYRSIFNLRFDEDLTLKEIAATLGMNVSTVYKYLNQAIQRIRIHMEKEASA